ncbi:MAG: NADH:ubiquinone reductase (Na(+)-transporting) subunit F [Candidatus Cloacimonetes bacterium]|nr:NADH:ubiquinone reductase (Na(+)-transporting) subunit F [Candidatus Cloacimonadota bacterium]
MVIGISVLVFTGVILGLVAILNIASAKLVSSGPVMLGINGEKNLEVPAGTTLLQALLNNGILLPSACGGKGACGVCKCKVFEGGGEVIPSEEGWLTRKEKKENVRLSCQVKLKGDMKIEVPHECMGVKRFNCKVRSNHNVATFIKELVVDIEPGKELHFQNGGYIQLEVPQYNIDFKNFEIEERFRDEWDKYKLWDLKAVNTEPTQRAYSMANHPAESNMVMLNIRIATPPPKAGPEIPPGIASSYVFNLKPGDDVIVSGPYGEFFIQETDREMCFIGGGAGMAPMRSHIFHLFHTEKTKRKATFWYGARSKREMFYDEEFKAIEKEFPNFKYHVALSEPKPEDNWTGLKGFIHTVCLKEYLEKHPDPGSIEYYLCGPPMMLKGVQNMLDSLGVEKDMIRFDDFGS